MRAEPECYSGDSKENVMLKLLSVPGLSVAPWIIKKLIRTIGEMPDRYFGGKVAQNQDP
jgi:hypothetical protein